MKKIKEFKDKVENNIIFKTTKIILYVIAILFLIVIVVQRFSNNALSVGGFRVFTIVSESMKGKYEIGDVLVSKRVEEEDIKIGDDVTYQGTQSNLKGLVITHRVIDIKEYEGKKYFVTKGIDNDIEDPMITYKQIYGKVIYKTIIFSFLSKLMLDRVSYYVIFILVGFIVSIEIISAMFNSKDEEEEVNDARE